MLHKDTGVGQQLLTWSSLIVENVIHRLTKLHKDFGSPHPTYFNCDFGDGNCLGNFEGRRVNDFDASSIQLGGIHLGQFECIRLRSVVGNNLIVFEIIRRGLGLI